MYVDLFLEDALPIGFMSMSSVPSSISILYYMCYLGHQSVEFLPLLYGFSLSSVALNRILHAVVQGLCKICIVRVEFVVWNVSCMFAECNACT